MNRTAKLLGALAALTLITATASAQGQYHDTRFHSDHFYPSRGSATRALPRSRVPVYDRYHNPYFYSGGVWYRPYGPRFVVVGPPIGAFVPFLPGFYTTVWFGGFPYYYANDTYYSWNTGQNAYEVVDPPAADESAASTEPPASDNLYTYPKNGQTQEQQDQDRYECHRWAVGQAGFDPTQNNGALPPDQRAPKRAEYQRAMTACMDGRGYTVK